MSNTIKSRFYSAALVSIYLRIFCLLRKTKHVRIKHYSSIFGHMGFAFPWILAALAALAIPVIIHLFYFRRYKKVYFTNVRFLRELQEQKSHTDRLRQLLILTARLAAISMIVLAFAQPFLGKNKLEPGRSHVSIYIDNSYSMGLSGNGDVLLEVAKAEAREIVSSYGPEDKMTLLTNEMDGSYQRWMGKEDMLTAIGEVTLSPFTRHIAEIQKKQSSLFRTTGQGNKEAYLFSDYQTYIADNITDSTYNAIFIPINGSADKNLYIDSAWLRDPVQWLNASNQLFVRVKNAGDKLAKNTRLSLQINGKVKSIADITIPGKGQVIDTLNFTVTEPGWQKGVVSFNDYPIVFDDKFYISFLVNQSNRILSIEEGLGKPFISSVFAGDIFFNYERKDKSALDYSSFRDYQLIILNEPASLSQGLSAELSGYIQQGGSVYLIPSPVADLNSYNSFLGSMQAARLENAIESPLEVNAINTRENIFKSVFNELPRNMDLPKVSRRYPVVSGYGATEIPLMMLNNGSPLVAAYKVGGGLIYLQGVPLDAAWSNLASHAIFPPMVYNFGVFGNSSQPLYFNIGKDNILEIASTTSNPENVMKMSNGSIEFIPTVRPLAGKSVLSIPKDLQQAGIYSLRSGEKELLNAAFNNPSRESELAFLTEEELRKLYHNSNQKVLSKARAGMPSEVKHLSHGAVLWKVCIILALAFLLVEILLLRYRPAGKA